ncbi:MAG: DnaA regulatory inactivator Hda [Gammaproteobacteria bacterium]|nr:MAG: DnaA regulatory inactivator Hda [Gammaproteobacteria bacterium]
MKIQLPLNFQFRETLSFDNFLSSNNSELIKILKSMSQNTQPQSVFVWGQEGSGRSHLCQALYLEAEEHLQAEDENKVAYLALSEEGIEPEVLSQLEHFSLVILDDLDAVLGKATQGNIQWDEALFHFYNRIKDSKGSLFMTSAKAPGSFESVLPDLKSRLGWDLVYQLEELSDADKIQALQSRAEERGLALSLDAGQYLLNRLPRDTHQLFSVLEQLDHQSLSQKRSLTVPFIKKVLNI